MLTGERVRLRAFHPDEFETVRGWFDERDKAIGPYQPYWLGVGDMVYQSLQTDNALTPQSGRLAIEVLEGHKIIGMIRYYTQTVVRQMIEFYEIGYAITDLAERRKGYARDACSLLLDYLFATYPVTRVGATTLGENEPSARLLTSLGFAHEGTIRKAVFISGQWADVFTFGLLREEWAARRHVP